MIEFHVLFEYKLNGNKVPIDPFKKPMITFYSNINSTVIKSRSIHSRNLWLHF